MILSSWSTKSWLSWFSMWNIWNTVWIRCWGNCLHLLGFWNFFVFFPNLYYYLYMLDYFGIVHKPRFWLFLNTYPSPLTFSTLKRWQKVEIFELPIPLATRFRTIFMDLHLFFCYKTFKNRHLLLDCICRIIRNPAGSL